MMLFRRARMPNKNGVAERQAAINLESTADAKCQVMKKLSQTWKQTRPGKDSCRKRELPGKNAEKAHEAAKISTNDYHNQVGGYIGLKGISPPAHKGDVSPPVSALSFLPFDWKMDSLNFESQTEIADVKHGNHACSIHVSEAKQFESPVHSDPKKHAKKRSSTPVDIKNEAPFGFSHDIVSPVIENNRSKTVNEEIGHVDGSEMKIELSYKQDCKYTRNIDSWDLPQGVVDRYKLSGINEIFEWQRECLLTGNASNGGNLVYSAPTSAGKTLVAELLMLKRVLSTKRKAIYILPFVSVAREKMFHLQELVKVAGIRVEGYMGAQSPAGGFAATDIAVCTIEKANSLVNRLMEEKKMSSLGIVVIDEIHMIGDGHRGYLLELMLSKIRFLQGSDCSQEDDLPRDVQVIGMSATLPNLDMLAAWLNADLYVTEYRPVPLIETIKVGQGLFDVDMRKISEINSKDIVNGDEEHVIPLCLETIRGCHSLLIFCPTKQWCEKLAKNIAENLMHLVLKDNIQQTDESNNFKEGTTKNNRTGVLDANAIAEVIEQLRHSPVGLDKTLADVVSSGVSFHHAGLTFDERDVIEGAFKRGAIRVLVATSTLSSGVNLPARRVILRTPIFHGKLLNPLVYKQMTGRAGRKGVDTKGESILICKSSEKQKGLKLLRSHLEPVYSCLLGKEGEDEILGMKRALLEIIAAGVASTRADVKRYANCTYLKTCLAVKKSFEPDDAIQNTIKYLVDNEFIRVKSVGKKDETSLVDESHNDRFTPSQLGSATLASALSPDEAVVVFRELQKARRCFVLENELHIVYQVMPISIQSQLPQLDWYHYFTLFEKLPPQYKRVGEIVGIEEGFLANAIRGRIPTRTEAQRRRLAIHQRFYAALALLELVNEIPLRTVSRRYNINKGLLQSLQASASTYAGMVTKFCEKLGWKSLEMLVDQFQSRLSFGVTRELCDLVRISLLNGARARLLYNSGYHTVSAVAVASPCELAKLLEHFAPFESCKNLQGESEKELATRKRVRNFWVTGRDGMTEAEAAEEIVCEAKELVRKDLASMGVEISKVDFLSDRQIPDLKSKENRTERMSSELMQKPLQNDCSQSQPKDDLNAKPDNTSCLNIAATCGPSSCDSFPAKQQLTLKANVSVNKPIGADGNALENENKENVELNEISLNRKSSKGGNSLLNASKKLKINIGCNNKNICEYKMKESSQSGIESPADMKDPPNKPIQQDLSNRLECERDGELHVDDENVCIRSCQIEGKDQDHDFRHCTLLQIQDPISDFNALDNQVNKTLESSVKVKPKASSSYGQNSNSEKKSMDIFTSRGSIDDSISECSIDDEHGSPILISSKEDISLNETDESKDIIPELSSDMLLGDFEVDSTGKPCSGRHPTADKLTNLNSEARHILIEDSFDECKNSRADLFHGNANGTRVLNFEKYNSDPFNLRLSESVLEIENESPDLLGDDLERCQGEAAGRRMSENLQSVKDEYVVGNDEAIQGTDETAIVGNRYFGNEIRESCSDNISDKSQCNFTKLRHIPERREFDWDKILSGSDSFANALCNVSAIQSSQNGKLKIENAAKVAEKSNEDNRCNNKSCFEDKITGVESCKGRDGGEIGDIRSLRQKGKRKTDHCEGDHACGVKRRSSERIAEKILQVGGTGEFTIIDVALNQDTFNMFIEVWGRKDSFSFSLARHSKMHEDANEASISAEEVSGVAVCLGGNTAYYIDFVQNKTNNVNKAMDMLELELDSSKKIVFDAKEHYKVLLQSYGVELRGSLHDPKVAAWLLDPSSKEMTLQELAIKHLPQKCRKLVNRIGNSYDAGSIGLMKHSAVSPRLRASIEAVLIFKLMSVLELRLVSEGGCASFTEVEMPLMMILAKMELNGFGFSTETYENLKQTLRRRASALEAKARVLAGRPFSISSPDDVAQVLYIELGLPPSGDPSSVVKLRQSRQTRRTKHLSTAKEILEKLRPLHPLPALILEWRKVNNALSTVIYPMQRAKCYCKALGMFRIHPRCQFHTVTGRIIIVEPCLQHIPKDFDFEIHDQINDGPDKIDQVPYQENLSVSTIKKPSYGKGKGVDTLNTNEMYNFSSNRPISMRSTFVPQNGNVLISADYSQLELRIITHFSRDKRLIFILNSDGDVFRMIAAETNQCPITCVTDLQRQTAKHICYGIIYGIGRKSLAEKLNVNEEEASRFMEKFKNRFTGIQAFVQRTIDFAKSKGYVVTIGGRKRYFSTINSKIPQARSQAERQAVNTTVQGSAADLVKKAMINVEKSIASQFCCKNDCSVNKSKEKKYNGFNQIQHLPKLVLQLHDELIYECRESDCRKFVAMLQKEMEQALKLEIRLPVKIRTGTSWGDLNEWKISTSNA